MSNDERNTQTWLVLSHAFNMDGRAASQTITDKIPHLLEQGISPIVISAITGKKDPVVEHYQVLPAFPVALRFDLRHYFRQRIESPFVYRLLMLVVFAVLLVPFLLEKLFIRIETHWSWAITAYFKGSRIIRKRRPALIYSTGGAYAAHLAGYWLARRFELPWIAEIHDPMIYPGMTKSRMRLRFSAWLEGKICQRADVAFWFTEQVLARARERHPELGERGHCVIPGADAPEFTRSPYKRGDHLIIGHFGSLSETRNLETFLSGLGRVLEKHPQWAGQIRLHIYGSTIDTVSARALESFPFHSVVKQFGRLETDRNTGESGRDRVLMLMNASDCLLLLHGTVPFCEEYIPSKTYEYLWTQRPILALVWRNPQMEQMLQALGHQTVPSNDPDMVAVALEELHARWTRNDLADSNVPSPYTAKAATQQIVALAADSLKRRRMRT